MSNTISVTNEVIKNKVITALGSILAPISAFSSDFSPDTNEHGNSIGVGLVAVSASGQIFNGDYTAGSDGTISKVSVPLTHYYKSFKITDSEATASNVAKLENLVEANALALGRNIMTNVFSNITTGNFGPAATVSVGASGFSFTNAKAVVNSLDSAGANPDMRALVLNTTAYNGMLPTSAQNLDAASITEGEIPKVYGMGAFKTNAMPNTVVATATTGRLVGFGADKSALAVGARLPICQGKDRLDSYEIFTLPGVGLDVAFATWYDLNAGTRYGRLETLFGSAVGNTGALRIISDN